MSRRRVAPLLWCVLTAANTLLCLVLLLLSISEDNYGRALVNLVSGLVSGGLAPFFFYQWKESAR